MTVVLPKADPRKRDAKPPMAEPTSVTARAIKPGVGYLRVAFFPGVNGQRFARELDRALITLEDCSRLIVDLRGNLGGFVGSLRLMSHLTPGRVPVGYSLTRNGEDRKWRPDQLACIDRLPSSRLDTLKMAVRFLVLHRDRSIRLATEGLGPKPFHGRVVMLVNEHTLSAGEMVAAFAQENGLARIVGSRTGGQVLGGGNFSVGQGFVLRFPAAAWYTWSGAVVEGRGVSPEVDVPLSSEELRQGNDNQLNAALDAVQSHVGTRRTVQMAGVGSVDRPAPLSGSLLRPDQVSQRVGALVDEQVTVICADRNIRGCGAYERYYGDTVFHVA